MIDQLVDSLKQVWKDVGLSLKDVDQQQYQQQQRVVLRQHA
jgi:hypothetical protein